MSSAFVESDSRRWTPRRPSSARDRRSVGLESSGVWSSLKSPVCRTVPNGVSTATATPSGMEWVTRRNRIRNGPASAGSPGTISLSSARSRTPCSSSLPSSRARVSAVPYTVVLVSRRRYGTAPMWSSCPWVRTTASSESYRRRRNSKSGSTRSMPGMPSCGNDRPQSMTRIRPSISRQAMFRPISPRPPRNASRVPGCGDACMPGPTAPEPGSGTAPSEETGVLQGLTDRLALLGRGREQRQAGLAGRATHQLQRGLQWDGVRRDEQRGEHRRELLVDLPRGGDVAVEHQVEHLADPLPHQVRGHTHDPRAAEAGRGERRPVVAGVDIEAGGRLADELRDAVEVAGGVLDADDVRDLSQREERGVLDAGRRPAGDVVHEDRERGGLGDLAEVL